MGLQQLKAEAIKLSPKDRLALVSVIVESLQNAPVDKRDRSAAIARRQSNGCEVYLKQGRKITLCYGDGKIKPERRTDGIGDDQVGFYKFIL